MIDSSWATPSGESEPRCDGGVLIEGDEGAIPDDPGGPELRRVRRGSAGIIQKYPSLDRAFSSAFDGCIGNTAAGLRTLPPFESPAEDNLRRLVGTRAADDSLERRTVGFPGAPAHER